MTSDRKRKTTVARRGPPRTGEVTSSAMRSLVCLPLPGAVALFRNMASAKQSADKRAQAAGLEVSLVFSSAPAPGPSG